MSALSSRESATLAVAKSPAGPKVGFRADVQGLRAIAVLAVILFHAGLPLHGGFVGVDVFFVISGFVITGMLMREWADTGRVNLAQFYVRRFMRLTPALGLVVAFAAIVSLLILSPLGSQQVVGQTGLGAMLLSANFVIANNTGGYFDVAAQLNPLLNLWSLSVEEQFYLVFPALLIGAWFLARRGGRSVPFFAVLVLAVVSFGAAMIDWEAFAHPFVPSALFGFYGPVGRMWEFGVGALLALAGSRVAIRSTKLSTAVGIAGLVLVGAALLVINGSMTFPGPWTILPVAGTGLLLVAGTNEGNPVSRALASRPMQWVGDRSYSLYLWHWPFISIASALWAEAAGEREIAAVLSVIPAVLSYRYVESRLRRVRPTRRAQLVRIVALILTPALLLPGLLWVGATNGFGSSTIRTFQTTVDEHLLRTAGCDDRVPVQDLPEGQCTFNPDASGVPIYLVGDSNAGHFSEAIVDAAVELDEPVIAATTNGCPFIDGYVFLEGYTETARKQCERYRLGMLDYLQTATPGVVVIAQVAAFWSTPIAYIGADKATATADTQDKLDYFAERMPAIVDELRAAGHKVLVVQQVPIFGRYFPQTCSVFQIQLETCSATISLHDAELQYPEAQAIISAATMKPGTMSIQLRDFFCDAEVCSTTMRGAFNYRDKTHITIPASHALAPRFEAAIRQLLAE